MPKEKAVADPAAASDDGTTPCRRPLRARGFPFSAGVPCDAQTKEHADGTVTEHSTTPFIFHAVTSVPKPEAKRRALEWLRDVEAPVRVEHNAAGADAERCTSDGTVGLDGGNEDDEDDGLIARILATLGRDGAAILSKAAPSELIEMMAAAGPDPPTPEGAEQVELSPATFGTIAHPFIMSLCDAVIGGQALRGGLDLEDLVVPPSLFTGGKPILSLPWELEDLALVVEGTADEELLPGCGGGAGEGDGDAKLVRLKDWNRPVAPFDLSQVADLHLSAAWVVSGSAEVAVAVGSHMTSTSSGGGVTAERAAADAEFGAQEQSSSSRLVTYACRPGDCLLLLGTTAHAYSPLAPNSVVLRADYQTSVLSQRRNMYADYPPQTALKMPEDIQRLIGYSMPGPVLNKFYCGEGSADVLTAYRAYGGRCIDWAGRDKALEDSSEKDADEEGVDLGFRMRWSLTLRDITEKTAHALTLHDLRSEWVPLLPPPSSGRLVTIPSTKPKCLELLTAAMLRDGAVILGAAVTPEICDRVMRDLEPYSKDVGGGAVGCVPSRSEASWNLACHPTVLALTEAVLGRQVLRMTTGGLDRALPATGTARRFPWQMHVCLTIPKQAGGERQGLHRDGDLTLLDLAGLSGIDHAVSCIWALDGDFTEERGTTRVVPGSHEWPRGDLGVKDGGGDDDDNSVPAVMKQGDVLIYTGRTIHGAGHNSTASPRVALNVAYNSSALKQEENMHVSRPPGVLDTWPAVLRQLVTGRGW